MPLGGGHAIVCPEAFVHEEQLNTLRNRHSFCVDVTLEEAALLQTNLLHTAPDTLLIDPGFDQDLRGITGSGIPVDSLPPRQGGAHGRSVQMFHLTASPFLKSIQHAH